ncbi:MAG TPA: acyl-CoA dehydrogenase family protein [Caulobacteraceae bacterium]
MTGGGELSEVSAERMLAMAREFAPIAAGRAAEMEIARCAPPEIVDGLRELGVFRMHVPRRYGGLELGVPASLPILEELAAADGAVGWTAMIGSHAGMLAARLPAATLDEVYAKSPDTIWACSLVPGGTAEVIPGGYRVSGRWPFASGCQHADWIYGFCLVTENGKPVASQTGHPPLRAVALPASRWTIEDTWAAEGLKGTGSHHVSLAQVDVQSANTFPIFEGAPIVPGPLYENPLAILPLHFGAIAVGLAEGALRDIADLAKSGKRYSFAAEALKDSPVFHHEVGKTQAQVIAARALLHAVADRQWAMAAAGPTDAMAAVEMGQAMAWIAQTCADAVGKCYSLGGSSVVYDASPLQRRLRDIHAVTQHTTLNPRFFAFAGEVLAGHPARHPMGG